MRAGCRRAVDCHAAVIIHRERHAVDGLRNVNRLQEVLPARAYLHALPPGNCLHLNVRLVCRRHATKFQLWVDRYVVHRFPCQYRDGYIQRIVLRHRKCFAAAVQPNILLDGRCIAVKALVCPFHIEQRKRLPRKRLWTARRRSRNGILRAGCRRAIDCHAAVIIHCERHAVDGLRDINRLQEVAALQLLRPAPGLHGHALDLPLRVVEGEEGDILVRLEGRCGITRLQLWRYDDIIQLRADKRRQRLQVNPVIRLAA